MADPYGREFLEKGKLYPVASGEPLPDGYEWKTTRVRATGEKRAPRKGEWYLSGATIEGYRARNDISTEYHIGLLVKGKLVWREASVTYEYVLQSDYGYGNEWEDVTCESTLEEAQQRKREYQENMPQYPYRIVKRKESAE